MSLDTTPDQGPGDERRSARDERRPVIGGGWTRLLSTSESRAAGIVGWVAIGAIAVAVAVVNALSRLADDAGVAGWEPWVWEMSSAASLSLLLWLPWLAARRAPWHSAVFGSTSDRLRFVAAHLSALLLYATLHVGLFVVMRHAAYAVMDAGPYVFGDRFLYELRKDTLSYGLFVAVFWVLTPSASAAGPRQEDDLVIRDRGQVLRVRLEEIEALHAAGNYVEVCLADGRRPLMRTTLAVLERDLDSKGFVRVHRSWLVNRRRVEQLTASGSGDWTVRTGTLSVPLSRRHRAALDQFSR